MRILISEAMNYLRTNLYVVYFRPEKDLPEEKQYAIATRLDEILIEEKNKNENQ